MADRRSTHGLNWRVREPVGRIRERSSRDRALRHLIEIDHDSTEAAERRAESPGQSEYGANRESD